MDTTSKDKASAAPKFNSKSPTIRRILREAQELSTSPSPDYTATPLEADLFEWHFTLRGPPHSPYADGIYHGRIVLPPTYPLRPPSFRFATPSGRFEANREICLSISGHHEETWQPAWGLRTALVALRSFMETDPRGQLGGLDASEAVRRRLATESRGWRCGRCCAETNAEIVAECERRAKEAEEAAAREGGQKREEVEIPADLKMGWRDEMEAAAAKEKAAAAQETGPAGPNAQADAESAELAEGFVQTAPRSSLPLAQNAAGLPARPAQSVPQPMAPAPMPAPRQQAALRRNDEGVPVWVDRLIVVLGVMLVAMVLRVVFAL